MKPEMEAIKISNRSLILYLSFIILCLISVFQLFGFSADRSAYEDFISNVKIHNPPAEFSSSLLKALSKGNPYIFFGILAVLGISTKLTAFNSLSKYLYITLVVYFLSYFLLHDYTQIRVAVASGIFLLSIPDLRDRNFKTYFFKSFLAIFLHYSAII